MTGRWKRLNDFPYDNGGIAAADEHRRDFPLHNIHSAKANGGEEYFLPGAHSDVGGSYNQANEKELEKEADESKKIYMQPSDEGRLVIVEGRKISDIMVINRGDPAMIDADRQDLIAQGWYKENEITSEVTRQDDEGNPTECTLTVERFGIHSAYCNIPLKIMAKYAREPAVKLKISTELEDRANIILGKETDLEDLEKTIDSYIATKNATKDSKPGDWIDDQGEQNTPMLKAIRHKHFHFSASKLELGYAPRFARDKKTSKRRRTRYEYNA